ncbi:MAG: hypothetical protein H0W89_01090 [Candidatus Levybacteria bacterium]|nr:hypothetical protein [Candidatus Levybacteria bacterium]
MTERKTDSIGQFRPKDSVTVQYKARGGGEVVWENRIADIPQWRRTFYNSPLMPTGVGMDTSNVLPGEKESHIKVRARHLHGETVEVHLDNNGIGETELVEDVTILVDATALTSKYRKPTVMNQPSAVRSKSGVISFRS